MMCATCVWDWPGLTKNDKECTIGTNDILVGTKLYPTMYKDL